MGELNSKVNKGRPKLKDIKVEADDLNAILDMSVQCLKLGRPSKFADSPEGLEEFKRLSIEYLEFIRSTNNNPDIEHNLIPDIESWSTYLNLTRNTILSYEKNRDENWREFISLVKQVITGCKKQLAFRQRIPVVLAIFDLCNNSGYVNSSEWKIQPSEQLCQKRVLSASELPLIAPKCINDKKNDTVNEALTLPEISENN